MKYPVGTRVTVTNPELGYERFKGLKGTVLGPASFSPYDVNVRLDEPQGSAGDFPPSSEWFFYYWELTPDTDPKAEEFLARIKKIADEPRVPQPAKAAPIREEPEKARG